MKALQQAADATFSRQRILCHGAGNQKQDIESSSGESWARNELACQKYSAGVPADRLQRAQKFQGEIARFLPVWYPLLYNCRALNGLLHG
ncbi:hypothetical protein P4S72_14950 [Vibrio sp. PP-XX7]